ncbi:hypothetical protein [Maridesulfovibrio zosterae]|uniref:hypothetical protein n=1 Tax=Maridesulfovibrio zosterae TaxID=82171 RepID=UPI0003F7862C|nr:hypothetical protein [Maridesulfovibrio zosterae]
MAFSFCYNIDLILSRNKVDSLQHKWKAKGEFPGNTLICQLLVKRVVILQLQQLGGPHQHLLCILSGNSS